MKGFICFLIFFTIYCACKSKRQLTEERRLESEQRKANMEDKRKEFDQRREQMQIEREKRREEFEQRMEAMNQRREARFQNSRRRQLDNDDDSEEAVLERLQYDQFQRFKKMKEDFKNLENLTAEEKVKNQSALLEKFLNTQNEQDQLRNEAMIRLQNRQKNQYSQQQQGNQISRDRQQSMQRRNLEDNNQNNENNENNQKSIENNIISNLEEQQQEILSQFEVAIWGDQHPFLSHWIDQFANYSPNGASFSPQMEKKANQLGIQLDKFNVDLNNEIFYTGYIQFDEKLKNIDSRHVATKYQPYLACRQKQKDKKMEL